MEWGGAFGLFNAVNKVALLMELADGLLGGGVVGPADAVLGTECRFVDFGTGRCGGDAAEADGAYAERVAGAKHGAHVMERPHIVEHHDERQLLGAAELFHREPVHFYGSEFSHAL